MSSCIRRGLAVAFRGASAVRLVALAATFLGILLVSVPAAQAAEPSLTCQPYSGKACMFPFPDNRLTTPDRASATGLHLNLPQAAMPSNLSNVPIGVAPYNQDDGFSPGSAILLHIPQLDTPQAFSRTHAVGLLNMSAYLAKRAPIMVIDEKTGQRQMIYSQLDANATSAATRNLEILPGSSWQDGHTYVVVLRDLRNAGGHMISAPAWFAKLRDGKALPAAERSQAKRYATIFKALKRAKVARDSSLYAAWDFTVASTKSLTGRLLSIRDQAFSQLGDSNLGSGQVQGTAPGFSVTSTESTVFGNGKTGTVVIGTYQVPCYLQQCGDSANSGFSFASGGAIGSGLYPTPTQTSGNVGTADFECIIPSSATPSNQARVVLFGHGLLSTMAEVDTDPITALASDHNLAMCGTNWWGLAAPDQTADTLDIVNLNQFPVLVDRLQQGVLNALLLGRLLDNPHGLASSAVFQQNGQSVLNTNELYYDGNSQGGIFGGLTTAVSPDIRRAVLGVTGEDYANGLVQRSTDFGSPTQGGSFSWLLAGDYATSGGAFNGGVYGLTLDVMDQLWDQADPVGYVQGLAGRSLPGTPHHAVLMQIAYGDHQVSMYAGAAEARSIGADAYEPGGNPASALTPGGGRTANDNLFYGLNPAPLNGSYSGSVIEVWDSGPGHTLNPPVGNLAPAINNPANQDPHSDPRTTLSAQQQISDFLQPNGTFTNVCGGQPCHSYDYAP